MNTLRIIVMCFEWLKGKGKLQYFALFASQHSAMCVRSSTLKFRFNMNSIYYQKQPSFSWLMPFEIKKNRRVSNKVFSLLLSAFTVVPFAKREIEALLSFWVFSTKWSHAENRFSYPNIAILDCFPFVLYFFTKLSAEKAIFMTSITYCSTPFPNQ